MNEFYNYIKGKNISIENGDNENEKKLKIEYEGKKISSSIENNNGNEEVMNDIKEISDDNNGIGNSKKKGK